MKKIILIFMILPWIQIILSHNSLAEEIQYRQLSLEEYQNKVAGGWIGQAIGVLHGQWTEGKWQGKIVPFDLEDWYRISPEVEEKLNAVADWNERRIEAQKYINDKKNWIIWTPTEMSDQDDLYIEFMFLHSILKYGLDVSGKEIAEDWISYLNPEKIWCANKGAYQNFLNGIWPPMSGHPRNTIWGDAIDFQIESDLFGLISPGLPRISNAWGDKVGHIMNYGDGVYAGMAVAAMYTESFFEKDPQKLVKYSLNAIPKESGYAKMIRDVLDLHARFPNWQDAWQKLEPKWGLKDGELVSGVDVLINGAYIYMGLLYGEGDFWKSMNISMRCGRDSDCNPSNVAGILGVVLGVDGIPEKWRLIKDFPIDNRSMNDIYPAKISWHDIIENTVTVGKWNVIQNGGFIENGMMYIPYQTPASPPLEQTVWEEPAKRR